VPGSAAGPGGRQVVHGGGDVAGQCRGQSRAAGGAGGGRAVQPAADSAPAGGGVEQCPVGRGSGRGDPRRPAVRVGVRGESPVGRLDGADHVAVAPRLLSHERVRHSVRVPLDPHHLRDHDRAACCAVIEVPLCRMPTMLVDLSAGEYVYVHPRTGFLTEHSGRPGPPGLRMAALQRPGGG
jgi:hypothetical protein